MSLLFQALALFSAVFVATQLTPVGLKKLVHVDEFLPTFKGLFGDKFGSFVQTLVGFTEAFMPAFLIAGILFFDIVWIFAAATPILFVMFTAALIHAMIWKNSPKQPILVFLATCVTLVFVGLM
jgi:hypothetical protein